MNDLTLRPLSLGEILDRSFSLYRRNFALFIGIAGIPQVLTLAFNLFSTASRPTPTPANAGAQLAALFSPQQIAITLIYLVFLIVVYLFSQGGTILAVAELYLGRTTSIAESLQKVGGRFLALLGVVVLNWLILLGASIFFVIPGIYLMCCFLVCLPAALIERSGPVASLSRSYELTKGFRGRAFMILALYIVLILAVSVLFSVPFAVMVGISTATGNTGTVFIWQMLSLVSTSIGSVLVSPIPLIANSIFYYDLRVRKEAFDLQYMMSPDPQKSGDSGVSAILP